MSRAVADDLRAVRERLVTYGWVQGNSKDAIGRCCIIGAMCEVLDKTVPGEAIPSRHIAARDALFGHISLPNDIADWNDAPGRTFAEVLALLDKAIAAEEARP